MKQIIFLFFILFIAACKQNGTPKNTDPSNLSPTTVNPTNPTGAETAAGQTEVVAIFKDVQVYAGSNRFVFENPNGKQINVDVPHTSTDAPIKMPKNLTQPRKDGPLGPNPQMLGKRFRLIYHNDYKHVAEILPEL